MKTLRTDLILKNASLIDETGLCRQHQDMLIRDGRIARICDSGSDVLPMGKENCRVIDCRRFFVTSGLPNLHVHTAMNIFRGIAEDVRADVWFNEKIFPYESKMTPEDVYVGTKLGIAEMIDNGVTVFADHYFAEEQVLRAAVETGIRMDLAPTVFGMSPDFPERLAAVREFILAHKDDSDRIAFHMGPHAPYTCPDDTLAAMADEARAMGIPVHIHVAEEEAQVLLSLEQKGLTPFQVLDRTGLISCGLLAAHGLYLTESDLPLLGRSTYFAFCPKTYMKLGSGRGGFFAFHSGLQFGFGSDGAASSNTLSPLEQARLFALLCKFTEKNAEAAPVSYIWRHLMSGHRALPFGTGFLRENAPADLVIWDLDTPGTFPVYDPVSAILYSADSRNVRYTIVAGDILKDEGRLAMDFESLAAEGRERQKALLQRGKGTAAVSYLRG